VIAAMRDPNADLAERLAGGAGDLAAGVTQLLRAFARGGGAEPEETREGDEFWESLRRRARGGGLASFGQAGSAEDDPWRAATTAEPPPPKPMAKKAVAKKAVAKQVAPAKAAPTKAATAKKVAKKATAKTVAKKATAKKVAKKATAKKVAKKATPRKTAGTGENE